MYIFPFIDMVLLIMAGVALLAVGRVLFKMAKNRKHLSEAEFRTYMKGGRSMSDEDRSRVTSHLGICDQCQGHIDDWIKGNPPKDSFVED